MATKLWKVLPVVAAVFSLGGCGGGNDSSDTVATPSSGGSIVACETANSTVNFAITSSNVPTGVVFPSRSTVGPMTYNGQAVTGQTLFFNTGNTTIPQTEYWTVASNGATYIAAIQYDGTVITDGTFYPENMNPGQTAANSKNTVFTTFLGFETITLAGQTFTNTCHFTQVDSQGDQADGWVAPGYGTIKSISNNGGTWQYNGNL